MRAEYGRHALRDAGLFTRILMPRHLAPVDVRRGRQRRSMISARQNGRTARLSGLGETDD
jgi:hypothetical protein